MNASPKTALNPKQLPLSKWTAVAPVNKEKHFIVVKLIETDPPGVPVVDIELQAVHSGRVQRLPWRALTDPSAWKRGWL